MIKYTMAKKGSSILEKIVPVLLFASIALAFAVGALWQKVSHLEDKSTSTENAAAQQTADPNAQAGVQVTLEQIQDIFTKGVIKFGDANGKLLLVEISDPSCPYCHIAAGHDPELNNSADPSGRFKLVSDGGTYQAPGIEMKKLLDSGKAAYAYIYFPGHGNGEMGAKALYCAYDVDKYWEVHDLLMTKKGYDLLNETVQNNPDKSKELADFLAPAMDSDQLKSCLDSGKYDERISQETSLASSLGVNGTPSFFINVANFAGAYNFTDMEPAVKQALGE
jgi:protein-disulfide isomerase